MPGGFREEAEPEGRYAPHMSKEFSPTDESLQGSDLTDPDTGLMRQCAKHCHSCILHPNPDKRLLEKRTLADYLDRIAENDEFVVCHNTVADLGLGDDAPPAICAGYMDEEVPEEQQEWRRSWRARMIKMYDQALPVPPPAPSGKPADAPSSR